MKLLHIILNLDRDKTDATKDKLRYDIVEYEVVSETADNYVVRYVFQGQKTRRVAKGVLMRPKEFPPEANRTSTSIWCIEEDVEQAKTTIRDDMERTINRMQQFHKEQKLRYEGLAALLPTLTPTTKRRTFEKDN